MRNDSPPFDMSKYEYTNFIAISCNTLMFEMFCLKDSNAEVVAEVFKDFVVDAQNAPLPASL